MGSTRVPLPSTRLGVRHPHRDFRQLLRTNFSVSKEFFDRFPVTMEIVILSFTMTTRRNPGRYLFRQ